MIIRFMKDGKIYEVNEYDVEGMMIYLSEVEKCMVVESKEGECLNIVTDCKNKRRKDLIVNRLTKDKNPIRIKG